MILKPGRKYVTIYLDAETTMQEVRYPMARTIGIGHQDFEKIKNKFFARS